jgi:hypothetical protein
MSNEITWRHDTTGVTLYATVRSEARTMWYTVTPALEALAVAHWASYAIALAETPGSSYFYVGDWPAALTTAGWYWIDIFQRAGGSPVIGDNVAGSLIVYWNGTTARPQAGDAAQIESTAALAAIKAQAQDGLANLDDFNAEVDTALTDYDPPTNAEMEARTLTAALIAKLTALLNATPSGAVVDDNDPDPSATVFETDLNLSSDGIIAAFCVFSSGGLVGQSQKINDWDNTSKVLTVASAFTAAPAAGDTFLVIGKSA